MVRSGDPEATSEIWGTLEELLLGCAVSRHGTRSWDSVAVEVRSRSPSAHHLTPEGCRERYRDLERRFSASDGEIGCGSGGPGVEIPWLEELRKLRVAELRREVQRYDVSILSLQLKVKKLQEERERSLLEEEDGKRKPDLKGNKGRKNGESPRSTSENIPGDGDSGRSCRESNSTDPKDEEEKPRVGLEEAEAAPEAQDKRTDRATSGDVKSAGEASYNGSSDTIAKAEAVANTARPLPLGDSGESMAESKGGEPEAEREGAKETSDVQSSASLSRRRRRRRGGRRKVFSGCSSGGDEPEADAVSPGGERDAAESQPLITFVEFIRAQKFGSVFERRLESQGSVRYRSMIRRHVDLEMVREKLEGRGSGEAYTSAEVFRDLLLLCCNAIVFYPKGSPESIAAVHLRGLVMEEMARTIRKSAQPPKEEEPIPPAQPFPPPAVSKLKSDPDRASKPLERQTSLVPLTACRKRSSLSGKAAAAAAAGWKEVKEEKEKHRVDWKEWEVEEDETPIKKRTREWSSVAAPRALRSNKTPGNAGNRGNGVSKSPNSISSPTIKSTAVENSTEATPKSKKKNGGGEAVSASKKKGAAAFLVRMKRSSPTSSGKLRNTLRSSSSSGGGGGKGGEQQKKGGRGDGRKDRDSHQSPGAAASKRAAENGAPVRRSVGRPPKRGAALPPPPPAKKAKNELGRTPPSRNRVRR